MTDGFRLLLLSGVVGVSRLGSAAFRAGWLLGGVGRVVVPGPFAGAWAGVFGVWVPVLWLAGWLLRVAGRGWVGVCRRVCWRLSVVG